MNYQGGFETFKEATRYMFESPSISDILFVVIGFSLAIGLLIVFPYMISKYKAKASLKREFSSVGKSLGLIDSEITLLWKCASFSKEPIKILQSKAVFEKCVNKLVKEDISVIEMIPQIRKKLKFDSLPWFLPLSNTRDIELYQTGFLSFEGITYNSAVWDKSELELHIAILDTPIKLPKPGDKVKFSFLREDDGRYYFQAEVQRVYRDGSKIVLVVPHTDSLSKIQLRESLRWKVSIPAKVYIYSDNIAPTFVEEPEDTMDGTIEDISTSGVRVCLSKLIDAKVENKVYIYFELKSLPIKVIGTVRNVRSTPERTCLGVKFDTLGKKEEEHIRKFILEEQRKTLKLYKTGEPTEGSSS